jgi:plasmid stability protein
MKSLLIRNIDEKTIRLLKRMAQSHHRSLQGEISFLLEQAVKRIPIVDSEIELNLTLVNSNSESKWSREEIYGNKSR